MNYRNLRVSTLIRDELAKIILREMEFPGLVTITEVETNSKLEKATVKISVLPSDKGMDCLRQLQERADYLEKKVLFTINIKPMPRLRFVLDPGPEKAASIEKILLDE